MSYVKSIVHSTIASLLILILLSVSLAPAFAETNSETAASYRFVSASGTDSGNCTTSACRSIQYAVNQSTSGDTILVSQGTYYYTATGVCGSLKTPAVVCVMNKSLAISGGFSTDWSTRDPVTHPTTIDGASTYTGVAVIGYPATTYLQMEDFTIRNGRAFGNSSQADTYGGGMLVQLAYVTLRDMVFDNNRAIGFPTSSGAGGKADGAAIRIQDAPAASFLQRVVFTNNQSLGGVGPERGGVAFGAVFIYNSNVTIEDSSFSNNLAQGGNSSGMGEYGGLNADALGGAIAIQNSAVTLNRVTVNDNDAIGGDANPTNGKGGLGVGGGIFIEETNTSHTTTLTLRDSIVINNYAKGGDAWHAGNSAGGGLDSDSSQLFIERSQFILNSSIGGDSAAGQSSGICGGGGIYLFAVRAGVPRSNLVNVVFADNFVNQGSGVQSLGNGGGGGMVVQGLGADITHATFARNVIGSNLVLGQALLVQPWLSPALPTDVTLGHSLIAEHTEGATNSPAILVQNITGIAGTLTFNYGVFVGNEVDIDDYNEPIINGLSTMTQLSSSSLAGFIAPGTPSYNYHLRVGSPAKDQADHSSIIDDIDNQDRPDPDAGIRDYGADEYYPFALFAGAGDSTLQMNWFKEIGYLEGGIDHYILAVSCEAGAVDPDQVNCGGMVDVGDVTHFTLTGLSNLKDYTITIFAYDASDVQIAASNPVTATPSDGLNFLPLLRR